MADGLLPVIAEPSSVSWSGVTCRKLTRAVPNNNVTSVIWRLCQNVAAHLFFFILAVVKNPPNNLWIIAAVLAPITVVALIIIIITAVLCRKNKSDFKADAIGNLNPRAKV